MDLARIISDATDEHLNSPQMAEYFITIPASIRRQKMSQVIQKTVTDLTITVAGVETEIEATVRYLHNPAIMGYHEKGGGQIDPDEPESVEILTVIYQLIDISHLLSDAQLDALAEEILEAGRD